ncbi:hypothetical protein ACFL47_04905 [Candidatus Latescibacterota bacterium]
MKIVFVASVLMLLFAQMALSDEKPQWSERIQIALDNSTHLEYDRGGRLPLYVWSAFDPSETDVEKAEALVAELDRRGIGLVCSWRPGNEESLQQNLAVARAQKKLGLKVNINATSPLYSFFNGDERTAHIDKDGKPFFDDCFGPQKMGCPFAIDFRKHDIRDRVEHFVKKYNDAGLSIDFIFGDWEIDGPLEVNRASEAAKKCTRCREHLGEDFDFLTMQKHMREMRSYLQYYAFSEPVLSRFPDALVGNYAVYPHDGYRYWYDYFEYYVDGQPYKADQYAKYRQWYDDFPATGYTFAMPVVYTWEPTYTWYDFENSDYRWFYNMLLVASNVGKSTPPSVPIISFVHWNTVVVSGTPDPSVKQMSEESYQELLWHLLLRGTDTFFMWSGAKEFPKETKLVHEVYAAAQQYGEFLEHGMPITFDVPAQPGTVVSGLVLRDRVLIRRTDFGGNSEPVDVYVGTKVLSVPCIPGKCLIMDIK